MSNELPDPWGPALAGKGVHSYGDLAAALGISKSTAHRLVTGKTSPSTIQAAADYFFAGDMNAILDLRQSTLRGYGPWEPPEAVLLLNPKQRQAIEAVIAAMVPNEGGAEDEQRPAATKKAPRPGAGLPDIGQAREQREKRLREQALPQKRAGYDSDSDDDDDDTPE